MEPAGSQKKAVCTAFTSVVRASPLKDAIDDKAFFMMLNANFGVLYQEGTLNLVPLWDALSTAHRAEVLLGLFLKFEEAGQRLGLRVSLPAAFSSLSEGERRAHLDQYRGATPLPDLTPAPPAGMPAPSRVSSGNRAGPSPAPAAMPAPSPRSAPERGASILAGMPATANDLKSRISWALVSAIRATPAGPRVNTAQLQYMLDANFEQLFDGARFDMTPVLRALLSIEGVDEAQLYVGIMRFKAAIEKMGVAMEEPHLNLPLDVRAALMAAARGGATHESYSGRTAEHPVVETPKPDKPDGETKAERRLRRFGLTTRPRLAKAVRVGLGVVIVAGISVGAWMFRPNRPLDVAPYNRAMPLIAAQLKNGVFIGVLDEKRWKALTRPQREAAVAALDGKLRADGFIAQVAIIDTAGRVLVQDSPKGLSASAFVLGWDLPK